MHRTVSFFAAVLLMFLTVGGRAATYYLSVNGSDTNPGTMAQPFATPQHAANLAAPGDTVYFLPGIYNTIGSASGGCLAIKTGGTASNPVRYTGGTGGLVTNNFEIYLEKSGSNVVIDGFSWVNGMATNNPAPTNWTFGSAIEIGNSVSHVTITNCFFGHGSFSPIAMYAPGVPQNFLAGAQNCYIGGNVFEGLTNSVMINTYGSGHLIEGNLFSDAMKAQGIRPFGSNIVVRLNTFTNFNVDDTQGLHPDIIQTFGNNGMTLVNFLFERNLVIDSPVQILQSNETPPPSGTQAYVTNQSLWGLTFQNNLFIGTTMQSSIDVPNVHFYCNTFYQCSQNSDIGLQFAYEDPSCIPVCGSYDWGQAYGGQVLDNAFVECNQPNAMGYCAVPLTWNTNTCSAIHWTNPQPPVDLQADYNFVSAPGGVPKSTDPELHGVNGGNPAFVSASGFNFQLTAGSVLRSQGFPIPGVTNDYAGNPRLPGVPYDIGAFQYAGSAPVSNTPPFILAQPQGLTLTAGGTAAFSVVAGGTAPLTYQWLLNGVGLQGANASGFTKANAQAADAGSYAVVVSNAAGSITSAAATLTVLASIIPPTIASQPQSLILTAGSTVSFSVVAGGTAPLAYQWLLNGAGLQGANANGFTKASAQAADAGSYAVVVSNAAGSITSAAATLTVLLPPTITSQPQGLSLTAGATAAFSVSATGTAPLTYQWLFNGAALSGATASGYVNTNAQPTDAGNYAVAVSNSAGSVTSAAAMLTVLIPPTIISQPQGLSLTAGSTAAFSVSAAGTAPLSYQWIFNGSSLAGATSPVLTKANIQVTDAGIYSVAVSNLAGFASSANAMLVVSNAATNIVASSSDLSLKLWLDFNEDFSNGHIPDMSGNGNDAWLFNATNLITATNGVFGSTAAQFSYVAAPTNSGGGTYALSQYLAVTNLTGFAQLSRGTISVWAQFGSGGNNTVRLLDNGYPAGNSGDVSAASNSWALCRSSSPYLTFTVYPSGASSQRVVTWPSDTVQPGGSNPNLSTTSFHLYSVTIDCPNNRAVAYYDGSPYMTNTINLPWISVYGSASLPWLCIGAASHNSPPQTQPTSGYFSGKMDDIRIYDRTLSPLEIMDLFQNISFSAPPAPHMRYAVSAQ